jgi:hypothetical protein
LRKIGKSSVDEKMIVSLDLDGYLTLEYKDKSLSEGGTQCSAGRKLRRHLGEAGAQLGCGVNNEVDALGAWKRRADERFGGLQKVIGFEAASCDSQMMHA